MSNKELFFQAYESSHRAGLIARDIRSKMETESIDPVQQKASIFELRKSLNIANCAALELENRALGKIPSKQG